MTEKEFRELLWKMFSEVSGVADNVTVHNAGRAIDYAVAHASDATFLLDESDDNNTGDVE